MLAKDVHPLKAPAPMCVTDSAMAMLVKDVHPRKALSPMCVTDSPMLMLVKDAHRSKALSPTCVTDSPMAMLVKDVHPRKALSPMCVTDSPMLMLVKDAHRAKALFPTCVTDSPMAMLVKDVHSAKVSFPMCITDSPMLMLVKDAHPAKAPTPICVTDSPMLMLVKDVHPRKALSPMCVIDSPMVMLIKDVHRWKALAPTCITDSPMLMLVKDLHWKKAPCPMCVTDSPMLMLVKDVHPRKALSPMCVTDSPMVMLIKDVHSAKASRPMCFTEPLMVTKTSWLQSWKALLEISVRLHGIFTPTHLCVWMSSMSSFVAASTSFLVYATVTSDSAQKNPAASSVSASSMIELSRSSSTFRILRSIGSRHGCCTTSIAFNSRTVVVIGRSRVMTPPCKVFNFTSQDIAAKGWWTPRLFLGADLRCFFAPGAVDSHTMKGINTGGGYIPNYSNSNWLMILQTKSESETKQNPSKIQLFVSVYASLFVGWWYLVIFSFKKTSTPNDQNRLSRGSFSMWKTHCFDPRQGKWPVQRHCRLKRYAFAKKS